MYDFARDLSQPFAVLCLLILALLAWTQYKHPPARRGLRWATAACVAFIVLTTPVANYLLLGSLEWQNPPVMQRPADTEAIVVLAGGSRPAETEGTLSAINTDGMVRCVHAARLYHQGEPCPVVLTGGQVDPDNPRPAEVVPMRELLRELGVPEEQLREENQSQSTYENAVHTAELLKSEGIRRIVLVTEALHMPRAAACFQAQGLEVIPSGCNYQARAFHPSADDFLPNGQAAGDLHRVWHEWMGMAWYWLHGRI